MVCGYVLVDTELEKALQVAEKISKVEGVKSSCAITGEYDVIAHFVVDDISDVGKFVVEKIHPIEGVCGTQTCVCVRCHGEACSTC